jgi:hypothetical protein
VIPQDTGIVRLVELGDAPFGEGYSRSLKVYSLFRPLHNTGRKHLTERCEHHVRKHIDLPRIAHVATSEDKELNC